jgi:DNA-binding MarR family transcriptional regulator
MGTLKAVSSRQARQAEADPDAAISLEATALRGLVQRFVRTFGLLSSNRTPCGKPLAVSHAHALMVLAGRAGRTGNLSQQALGKVLGIDKSNVARLCVKMERAGHVKQVRSPLDGRARLLSLTAAGEKTAAGVERSSQERFRELLDALGPRSRRPVLSALEQLNDAAGRLLEPGTARRRLPGGSP